MDCLVRLIFAKCVNNSLKTFFQYAYIPQYVGSMILAFFQTGGIHWG